MPKTQEPKYVTQLDQCGNPETIDETEYPYKLLCPVPGCGQIRYIKLQDVGQSKLCKPCQFKMLKKHRARASKKYRFIKKHGKAAWDAYVAGLGTDPTAIKQ